MTMLHTGQYRRGGRPRLVALRHALGLTTIGLASRATRINQDAIARYEAGYIPLNFGKLRQLISRYQEYADLMGLEYAPDTFAVGRLCATDFARLTGR